MQLIVKYADYTNYADELRELSSLHARNKLLETATLYLTLLNVKIPNKHFLYLYSMFCSLNHIASVKFLINLSFGPQ